MLHIKNNDSLYDISNPKEVYKKAKKYFGKDIELYHSPIKGKKYMIIVDDKKIHFGSDSYEDYTKHKDDNRRDNYLRRAQSIKGNWEQNKYSPNNLSINILW